MTNDKETDNVVPFYRFPEPPAKPVRISREDYLAQVEGFVVDDFTKINNPMLLKIHMLIEEAKADWRPNGVLTFSSSSNVEWDSPEFYAPEPIPDYCYEMSATLSWGIRLKLEFYGRDDVKVRDICSVGRHAPDAFQALLPPTIRGSEQACSCLEDLYDRFRKVTPTALVLPAAAADDEVLRFVFTQYDHTYLVVRFETWKPV